LFFFKVFAQIHITSGFSSVFSRSVACGGFWGLCLFSWEFTWSTAKKHPKIYWWGAGEMG